MPIYRVFNTITGDYERFLGAPVDYNWLEEAVGRIAVFDAIPPEKRRIRDTSPGVDMTWYKADAYEIHEVVPADLGGASVITVIIPPRVSS